MKKLLIIFCLLFSLTGYSQSWVVHNDSLFMKRGNDSIYYNRYMFFDHFMRLKAEVETAQSGRQQTLVSGTNIKTINGQPILGSGDIVIAAGVAAWGTITGVLSSQTDLQTALNGKLAINGSAAALTGFPVLNQNTTGTAAGLSSVLSFANGGISASAATSATTGAMTVVMATSVITITPTGACTFNASGGVAGQVITFAITTAGTSSFVLTFGTNFRKTGTLATGTTAARFFSVTFICINGTTWQEISRTAVQT